MKKKLYQFFEGKGSGERGRDMKMKKKGEKQVNKLRQLLVMADNIKF